LQTILLISAGAITGASLRYFLAQYVARLIPSTFPYGTLVINFTACVVLGFFLVWTSERVIADPRWRIVVAIGFCGSYSTYSSFAFETFALIEKGQWLAAGINVAATNVLCFAAVAVGAAIARVL
jgi:CrcB protein